MRAIIHADTLNEVIENLSSPLTYVSAISKVSSSLLADFINFKAKRLLSDNNFDGTPKSQTDRMIDEIIQTHWVQGGLQKEYKNNPNSFLFSLEEDSFIDRLKHLIQADDRTLNNSVQDVSDTTFVNQLRKLQAQQERLSSIIPKVIEENQVFFSNQNQAFFAEVFDFTSQQLKDYLCFKYDLETLSTLLDDIKVFRDTLEKDFELM